MKRFCTIFLAFGALVSGCTGSDPMQVEPAKSTGQEKIAEDVAITSFSATPGVVEPGDVLVLHATVANLGLVDTPAPFTVGIFEPTTGAFLARRVLSGLSAGSSLSGSIQFNVPAANFSKALNPGPYTLVCGHDFVDSFPENDRKEIVVVLAPLDTIPPAPPIGLSASASTDYQPFVNLNWTDNAEADLGFYTLYRGIDPGGPYTQLADGIATSEYTDDTVVLETAYYYVVTATDESGIESAFSIEANAVPRDTTAPALAQNLTTIGSLDAPATISVNWDDSSEPAANFDHFNLYRALVANFGVATLVSSPTVSEGIDTTVTFLMYYYYWVTVVDDAGNECAEVIVGPESAVNVIPPAVPGDLAATITGAGEISVTWAANTEVDLEGYQIWINNASPATDGANVYIAAPSESREFAGLAPGDYFLTIRAGDTGGNTSSYAPEIGPIIVP